MSPSKENYLKIIFELEYDHRKIINKNIADIMGVSAPSVSEMLAALVKDKLVEHSPYNQITLTAEGHKLAKELVKKHRLWEVFLVDDLGYTISDVHQAADTLEHATSGDLIDRLNKFLDYPTHCPHGGIIPDNSPEQNDNAVMLADLKDGQTATIKRVIDNHEFLNYFAELHLELGDQLKIDSRAPFDGPLTVTKNGQEELQIGLNAATFIFMNPPEP
ncbi:Iron dependent repressor [Agrilactobacillus composti DSM 18527 = JCM 14202]|uniref:Manganese transport regulator n=1 Tax=Agrilactobacillus composti DSM 18527 = JCM 14202 TaxID=1423734 RepID=X0PDU8_9LACO|nr:metal-dependent transcriptional regulator [Agrilactobacillus composti]KRM31634.1 Iron dependent repressor [Agrilactobacillus composti DSM 18527 = JCM 14202]GAF39333.1 Mn-dependent transcriptional regulator MntR [Agrilactobacillus composti DSM 18527 = JCM 14202]